MSYNINCQGLKKAAEGCTKPCPTTSTVKDSRRRPRGAQSHVLQHQLPRTQEGGRGVHKVMSYNINCQGLKKAAEGCTEPCPTTSTVKDSRRRPRGAQSHVLQHQLSRTQEGGRGVHRAMSYNINCQGLKKAAEGCTKLCPTTSTVKDSRRRPRGAQSHVLQHQLSRTQEGGRGVHRAMSYNINCQGLKKAAEGCTKLCPTTSTVKDSRRRPRGAQSHVLQHQLSRTQEGGRGVHKAMSYNINCQGLKKAAEGCTKPCPTTSTVKDSRRRPRGAQSHVLQHQLSRTQEGGPGVHKAMSYNINCQGLKKAAEGCTKLCPTTSTVKDSRRRPRGGQSHVLQHQLPRTQEGGPGVHKAMSYNINCQGLKKAAQGCTKPCPTTSTVKDSRRRPRGAQSHVLQHQLSRTQEGGRGVHKAMSYNINCQGLKKAAQGCTKPCPTTSTVKDSRRRPRGAQSHVLQHQLSRTQEGGPGVHKAMSYNINCQGLKKAAQGCTKPCPTTSTVKDSRRRPRGAQSHVLQHQLSRTQEGGRGVHKAMSYNINCQGLKKAAEGCTEPCPTTSTVKDSRRRPKGAQSHVLQHQLSRTQEGGRGVRKAMSYNINCQGLKKAAEGCTKPCPTTSTVKDSRRRPRGAQSHALQHQLSRTQEGGRGVRKAMPYNINCQGLKKAAEGCTKPCPTTSTVKDSRRRPRGAQSHVLQHQLSRTQEGGRGVHKAMSYNINCQGLKKAAEGWTKSCPTTSTVKDSRRRPRGAQSHVLQHQLSRTQEGGRRVRHNNMAASRSQTWP